jgi:hypothetical protein
MNCTSALPDLNQRRFRLLIIVILAVFVAPSIAEAQTDYSLRIRSLGSSFAGLVDDPFTDAYLNPARVGDLGSRHLYFARFPSRTFSFYYPDVDEWRYRRNYLLPQEVVPGDLNYRWMRSYTPYTIGFVSPVSGATTISIAVEAAVSGYDDGRRSDDFRIYNYSGNDRVTGETSARGDERNVYHFVADVGLGTGNASSEGTRWGTRLRAAYTRTKQGEMQVTNYYHTGFPNTDEVEYEYGYSQNQGEFERTDAQLSAGLFRNDGFVSQAVIGAGAGRDRLVSVAYARTVYDEDFDGNGRDGDGYTAPYYTRTDRDYDADRTYDQYEVFARLGFRWGDRVRSFHTVSWQESDGDGAGDYLRDFYYSDSGISKQINTVSLVTDGSNRSFQTDNSVGFSEQLLDNLLFAFGLRARIEYTEFQEDGAGTGTFQSTEGTAVIDLEAPYDQFAGYEREYWLLSLPAGLEWSFHRNVAWRFGVDFRATRLDVVSELSRDIELPAGEDLDDLLPFEDKDQRIEYATSTYLSMGFTFGFRDRLSLEILTAVSASGFNAAHVGHALLGFHF